MKKILTTAVLVLGMSMMTEAQTVISNESLTHDGLAPLCEPMCNCEAVFLGTSCSSSRSVFYHIGSSHRELSYMTKNYL